MADGTILRYDLAANTTTADRPGASKSWTGGAPVTVGVPVTTTTTHSVELMVWDAWSTFHLLLLLFTIVFLVTQALNMLRW